MKNIITRLSYLGVIEINGEDAAPFLQAQLTSDIAQLPDNQSQFSAWCNPQGRVIANFIIARTGDQFLLIMPVEMIETVSKRLKMFVLRAKVGIVDRSNDYQCMGIVGDDILNNLDKTIVKIPVPAAKSRSILVTSANQIKQLQKELVDDKSWQLLDIEAGIPWIYPQTSEQLLPQELALEDIGGLSYNKGCYPGQEIIARLHFRGQLKRLLFAGQIKSGTGIPDIGAKLFAGSETQSIGMLINRVESQNFIQALVVLNIEQAKTGNIVMGDGTVFLPHPLSRH